LFTLFRARRGAREGRTRVRGVDGWRVHETVGARDVAWKRYRSSVKKSPDGGDPVPMPMHEMKNPP